MGRWSNFAGNSEEYRAGRQDYNIRKLNIHLTGAILPFSIFIYRMFMTQQLPFFRGAAAMFGVALVIFCISAAVPQRASAIIDKIECCEKTFQPNPEYISVYAGKPDPSNGGKLIYEFKITGLGVDLVETALNGEMPVTGNGTGVNARLSEKHGGIGSYIVVWVEVKPDASLNTTFTIRIKYPAGADEFRVRTSPATIVTSTSAIPSICAVGDTCIVTMEGTAMDEIAPNMADPFFHHGGSVREVSRSATKVQFALTCTTVNTGFSFHFPEAAKNGVYDLPIFVRRNLRECMQPYAFVNKPGVGLVLPNVRWEYPDLNVGNSILNNNLIFNRIRNTYNIMGGDCNLSRVPSPLMRPVDSMTNVAICALMEQPTAQKPMVEQIVRIPDFEFVIRNTNPAPVTQPFVVLVQSEGKTLYVIIVDQKIPGNSSITVRWNRSAKVQSFGGTAAGSATNTNGGLQANNRSIENLLSPETKKKLQRYFGCPFTHQVSTQPQGMDWQDASRMTIVVNPAPSMLTGIDAALPKQIPETDMNDNTANFLYGNPVR